MASSDRLRALVDLSRTISSSLDLEDVLRRFTDHATAVTGAAATAVSLWDRDRDVLITLADYEKHVVGEIDKADEEFPLADYPDSRRYATLTGISTLPVSSGRPPTHTR